MEKRTAHYRLDEMQAEIARLGALAFTQTAIEGGAALGLTVAEMLAVITALERRHLFKSMTSLRDSRIWQDVYHAPVRGGRVAYIKLTRVAQRPVIQFKEK